MNPQRYEALARSKWVRFAETFSFFLPPLGIIGYFLVREDYPPAQRTMLYPALIGFAVVFVASFLSALLKPH